MIIIASSLKRVTDVHNAYIQTHIYLVTCLLTYTHTHIYIGKTILGDLVLNIFLLIDLMSKF